MEKVESSTKNRFIDLTFLELGYDDIAKKRVREQLGLSPLENEVNNEEDEFLMFLLCRSVLN